MSALITQCPQRLCKPEQIFRIGATRTNRRSNLPRYVYIRRMAKKGFVISRGNVNQPLTVTAVIERQSCGESQITILFPHIQMLEYLWCNPKRHALANRSRLLDQSHYAPRRFRSAPVVVRTLPEPAGPALNRGGAFFQIWEIHFVNQRAIAKQPDRIDTGEVLSIAVVLSGVGGHYSSLCSQ